MTNKARWYAALIGATAGVLGASTALGDPIRGRCTDDQLTTPEQGKARNDWALKCEYITQEDYDYFQRKGSYIVFDTVNAPISADDACIPGLVTLAPCPIGCYHPQTELLFDGGELPIASAAHSAMRVTSMASESSPGRLALEQQEIEFFTVGATKKPLHWIRLADGRSLGVTNDHPMVLDTGIVVPARRVAARDLLLTTDGPSRVVSVEILPYEGEVWNVQPVSETKIANIHVASGVLTGSIRFQNQWASESFRLWQRARIDVGDL
ncbi:hypothetical protein BE11_02980 [Sorangium cellulosum]|nr:hypothetical protein BE11_02980 [Sorangium cellulosum]